MIILLYISSSPSPSNLSFTVFTYFPVILLSVLEKQPATTTASDSSQSHDSQSYYFHKK